MKMGDCFNGLFPAIVHKEVTGVAGVTPQAKAIISNALAAATPCNTSPEAHLPCVSEQATQHLQPKALQKGVSDQVAEIVKNDEPETAATPETPWREMYEERAGVMEHEAGFPRNEAEIMAYLDTFAQFVRHKNPALVHEFESLIHQPPTCKAQS